MFPLVIFVAIISSSLVFLKWNTVKRANKRDVKFYSDKRELKNSKFYLYLRAFEDDVYEKSIMPDTPYFLFGTPKISVDIYLYNTLSKHKPIIKITNTIDGEEEIGSSQLSLNDDWKTKVRELMKLADKIFIKPSNTNGLLWELDQIFKSNYLYKTIFIGSYGSNNLKEIERIKRKKFNNLLKSRYSVRIKKKPFWINSGIFYFFTIDAMEINYKSSSSLQKIIKRQEKLSLR